MSSSAHFPTNDLKRRKLQTSLPILTLALSVASTLFLLLFSNRLGLGIAAKATGTLTLGLNAILGQFLLFIGVLVFAVGAVLTSFIVFLMMAQRTRDFGLIKAAGCPNSLVAGYFMTELLTINVAGCVLGIGLGFLADFAIATFLFSGYTVPMYWFALVVFVAFFLLALFIGLQPILKASKMSALSALSPVTYYGLIADKKYKPMSRRGITWRIASRSLGRRQSVSVRVLILLSIVFVLLTVSVAGGIIASDTTTSWVLQASGGSTIAVAHSSMGNQYTRLLSKFSSTQQTDNFNYSDPQLAIPPKVDEQIKALSTVSSIDRRLVLHKHIEEVANFTVIEGQETLVGGYREGDTIIVGLDPKSVRGELAIKGRSMESNDSLEAVVGDSITQTMYSPDPRKYIVLSDPFVEGIGVDNTTFRIVGICVDPLNNGFVTYVSLGKLMNTTGITEPNLLLINLKNAVDRDAAIAEINSAVKTVDSDLAAFDIGTIVEQNGLFISSTWQTILVLPFLTLATAAMCLVGYMMLAVDEQRQEFAILRAVGAKPRIIIDVSAIQSAALLLSSVAIGISVGIIITLIILMANPIVTTNSILLIIVWLVGAVAVMFALSLYPALKLSKTSILKGMS